MDITNQYRELIKVDVIHFLKRLIFSKEKILTNKGLELKQKYLCLTKTEFNYDKGIEQILKDAKVLLKKEVEEYLILKEDFDNYLEDCRIIMYCLNDC